MKTIKHALLVVLMLASFSNTKAQCNLWTLAYTNGTDVQCYAHVDSSSLPLLITGNLAMATRHKICRHHIPIHQQVLIMFAFTTQVFYVQAIPVIQF